MRLSTQELSVGYGNCAVIEQVNLNLVGGDLLCLLGANGCGKSTLIKTLLNLIPPCKGQVFWNGKPLDGLPAAARASVLAYVPQHHANPLGFAVADVVLMGRTRRWGVFGNPGPEDHRAVDESLDQLGILNLKSRDFSLLSGGQQQLVLIARALCQGADTLVLDEPTANLDLANAARVMQTMTQLAAQGKIVVFSSHNPQDALSANATVCLLKHRQVLAMGSAREVMTSANLSLLYGLPVSVWTSGTGHVAVAPGAS